MKNVLKKKLKIEIGFNKNEVFTYDFRDIAYLLKESLQKRINGFGRAINYIKITGKAFNGKINYYLVRKEK